jgi:uncharacterized protein (DUF3084 family)
MTLAQLMAIMPYAGQRASGLGLVREEGARRTAQAKQTLVAAVRAESTANRPPSVSWRYSPTATLAVRPRH